MNSHPPKKENDFHSNQLDLKEVSSVAASNKNNQEIYQILQLLHPCISQRHTEMMTQKGCSFLPFLTTKQEGECQ